MNYTYYTKLGKFQTNNGNAIPWDKLHSPNEETPALELSNGFKQWRFEGNYHRLSGPARIWSEGERFFLNGFLYNFNEWVANHPNIDIYLDAIGMTDITEKVIWLLKHK